MAREFPTPEGMEDPTDQEFKDMILHAHYLNLTQTRAMIAALETDDWLKERIRNIYWFIYKKIDKRPKLITPNEEAVITMELDKMWVDLHNEWEKRHAN